MTRMSALIALAFALAVPPLAAQDEPSAIDAGREAAAPAVETAPPAAAASAPAAETEPRSPRFQTMDRLELDSTAITGNRELPKVLYIVPWKKADLGDLTGRPANSLLDEVLAPVDREVFRRETEYFARLNAEAPQPPASGEARPAPTDSAEPAR